MQLSLDTADRGFLLPRRTFLKAGVLGLAGSTIRVLNLPIWAPLRPAAAATSKPDIQFDFRSVIAPSQVIDGVEVRFGPVYTLFVTTTLTRTPDRNDQSALAAALDTIEANYEFGPEGVLPVVSYGLPYFNRLNRGIVSASMPRLLSDRSRIALEEAQPAPTDVHPSNLNISKVRFNVPVVIEQNDALVSFRSDKFANLTEVSNWLFKNSNLLAGKSIPSPSVGSMFSVTSERVMFASMGLPRGVADANRLPFAKFINPKSPMWMGFADQQVAGSGPPEITTFQGNPSSRLTTARSGDYFDNGSIQHLSHVIQDLEQFYGGSRQECKEEGPFIERVQYMFRSNPPPSLANPDQCHDGGGPAFLPNEFKGPGDAEANARGIGTPEGEHRMGHVTALQRSSRAQDGTPIHIRMDGPGFDALDVPGGSQQPKLQFSIFVPTADFFATMRRNQASLDLAKKHNVPDDDNGLERFLTATRRQNYLVPPRRNRAFPLAEIP